MHVAIDLWAYNLINGFSDKQSSIAVSDITHVLSPFLDVSERRLRFFECIKHLLTSAFFQEPARSGQPSQNVHLLPQQKVLGGTLGIITS